MPVTTILLAAGRSTRMGQPKLLLPHPKGGTWGEHLVGLFSAFGPVVVVTNPLVADLWADVRPDGTLTALNHAPERGLFSSVIEALPFCGADSALFLHPIDCPFDDSSIPQVLVDAWTQQPHAQCWFSPVWQGRKGHPSLISPGLQAPLLRSPPTAILRDVLAPFPCVQVASPSPQILWNFNTPEEAQELWSPHTPTFPTTRAP